MRTWEPMATYPFRLTGKSMWSPVHAEGYSSSLCIHYISGSSPLSAVCLVAKPILLLFLFTPSSTIAFFSLALPFPLIHDSHKDKARALYLWIESEMQCMRKHGCKKRPVLKNPYPLIANPSTTWCRSSVWYLLLQSTLSISIIACMLYNKDAAVMHKNAINHY